MKKLLLIVLFSLFFGSGFAAEWDFNKNCQQAYTATLSLKFDAADSLLTIEKAQNPANVCVDFVENYRDFLEIFISEDIQLFERRELLKNQRLQRFEKLGAGEPFKNFGLAAINLQWAFSRLKFGEYFKAAFEIRRAYLLLEENRQLFPGFAPDLLGSGVLNALIGAVPPKFNWILQLASMQGSVEKGRAQLYDLLHASQSNPKLKIWQEEALFYLSFIELNLAASPESAVKLLEKFDEIDSKSNLMVYARVNILMKNGSNDQAAQLLASRSQDHSVYRFHYLDYLQAETLLRKLSPEAKAFYQQYLNDFKGKNYRTDAIRKIAWISLISGDSTAYKAQIKQVLKETPGDVGADKDALREAEGSLVYHPVLLKTRLLFDGGYYDAATKLLRQVNPENLNIHDRLEYYYRLGRIMDESGDSQKALDCYAQTLDLGAESKYYYPANAALKSGELYEQQGNFKQAKYFYNRCLKLDPESYSNSIHQKARAGLLRLP
ncbi:MAG: tetratricopeptide repeat protein [Bacteroidales bacterium]|nr:tetratricopeptide repeat protein [Bacteroidales bacterium]